MGLAHEVTFAWLPGARLLRVGLRHIPKINLAPALWRAKMGDTMITYGDGLGSADNYGYGSSGKSGYGYGYGACSGCSSGRGYGDIYAYGDDRLRDDSGDSYSYGDGRGDGDGVGGISYGWGDDYGTSREG